MKGLTIEESTTKATIMKDLMGIAAFDLALKVEVLSARTQPDALAGHRDVEESINANIIYGLVHCTMDRTGDHNHGIDNGRFKVHAMPSHAVDRILFDVPSNIFDVPFVLFL